jgi:hypothetical protein
MANPSSRVKFTRFLHADVPILICRPMFFKMSPACCRISLDQIQRIWFNFCVGSLARFGLVSYTFSETLKEKAVIDDEKEELCCN